MPNVLSPKVPTNAFINGIFQPASSGSTFPVIDPASGDVLAEVADCPPQDAIAAIDAADRASAEWAATAPRARGEILRRAFELMIANKDELAELIVRENGKALPDAIGEVTYAAEFFRWFSEEAVRAGGEIANAPSGAHKIVVLRQPIGIALLITPWNFPAAMLTRKIGPALAAGCTVVCKPAKDTPLSALAIAAILQEAGVPDGVVNVVTTSHSGAFSEAAFNDGRIRKLSFTGSTEVGRTLLAMAAPTVISCSMELGGNAPFIVFGDANLDAAIEGAMVAKMRNGGEACTSANRFYVESSIVDEFSSRLAQAMGDLRVGPGLESGVQVGPLVNEEARKGVSRLVEGARSEGARVLVGGTVSEGSGYFYPPTVLADVPPGADILKEEIFGPVAPIVSFETEAQVIELANDTEFGLVSYIYTDDLAKGLRVSEAIESGMVGLNRGLVSDPAAPFGGVKQSGLGREGGHEGIAEYLEMKYIATNW